MQPFVQIGCPEFQNHYPNENWKCEKNDKVFCRKIGNFFKFLKISNHILCSHIGVQINFDLHLKQLSGTKIFFVCWLQFYSTFFANNFWKSSLEIVLLFLTPSVPYSWVHVDFPAHKYRLCQINTWAAGHCCVTNFKQKIPHWGDFF